MTYAREVNDPGDHSPGFIAVINSRFVAFFAARRCSAILLPVRLGGTNEESLDTARFVLCHTFVAGLGTAERTGSSRKRWKGHARHFKYSRRYSAECA